MARREMDRFEDLRTFVTLAQTGGFAAAADRLGIVKSAVSRRIRDLEERLDVRLVHRTSRRISLTEAGRVYQQCAEEILRSVEALDETVKAEGHELAGLVRIAMPVSFATNCFAAAMVRFQSRYPQITLEIDANDGFVDIVQEGIDVAIRIARLKDSTLVARRVVSVRHVVCASPAYLDVYGRPQRPEDLPAHVGIGYTFMEDDAYWTFREGVIAKAPIRMKVSNGDIMREVAKAGGGIAFLPSFIVADAILDGSLELLLEDFTREPVSMHIVFPASSHVPARVRAVIDFLVETYADNPAWERKIEARKRGVPYDQAAETGHGVVVAPDGGKSGG